MIRWQLFTGKGAPGPELPGLQISKLSRIIGRGEPQNAKLGRTSYLDPFPRWGEWLNPESRMILAAITTSGHALWMGTITSLANSRTEFELQISPIELLADWMYLSATVSGIASQATHARVIGIDRLANLLGAPRVDVAQDTQVAQRYFRVQDDKTLAAMLASLDGIEWTINGTVNPTTGYLEMVPQITPKIGRGLDPATDAPYLRATSGDWRREREYGPNSGANKVVVMLPTSGDDRVMLTAKHPAADSTLPAEMHVNADQSLTSAQAQAEADKLLARHIRGLQRWRVNLEGPRNFVADWDLHLGDWVTLDLLGPDGTIEHTLTDRVLGWGIDLGEASGTVTKTTLMLRGNADG